MALYKDSVGNTYDRLPTKPPTHSAKAAGSKVGRQNRNHQKKYEKYRAAHGGGSAKKTNPGRMRRKPFRPVVIPRVVELGAVRMNSKESVISFAMFKQLMPRAVLKR